MRPMLAMVPTITALARTSLLTGQRCWGDQATERKGLQSHWHVQQAHGTVPQLFHRADVGDAGHGMQEVADAIAGSTGLVTVVVNAVDEGLSGSAQYVGEWTLASLPALRRLLELARRARRSVLLASDHGSVWATSDAGEPSQVVLQDRRLDGALNAVTRATPSGLADPTRPVRHARFERAEDGTLTVSTSDAHFFRSVGTAGTHGGLTLQEAVAPLLLLADANAVDSARWQVLDVTDPAWLMPPATVATPLPLRTRPADEVLPDLDRGPSSLRPRRTRPTVTDAPTPRASLLGLDDVPEPAAPAGMDVVVPVDWGAALLERPAFAARLQGRIVGARDVRYLNALLAALEAGGYRCSLAQVAGPLGTAEASVRHFVSKAVQVFNVDGYAVLTLEQPTGMVRLDAELLQRQFG
jgi:hypothetical protein